MGYKQIKEEESVRPTSTERTSLQKLKTWICKYSLRCLREGMYSLGLGRGGKSPLDFLFWVFILEEENEVGGERGEEGFGC